MIEDVSLYVMALFYIAAGINHFKSRKYYIQIIPPWLPFPKALNYTSGAAEIILGTMLFPLATRNFAAWGIIVLLILVFPANVQMMLNYKRRHNPKLWLTILRLPLQLGLIWWAWLYTKH
jgi:uncharacterized membrane protein